MIDEVKDSQIGRQTFGFVHFASLMDILSFEKMLNWSLFVQKRIIHQKKKQNTKGRVVHSDNAKCKDIV